MTEESDTQQMNLIEYEEFIQSENSNNHNIAESVPSNRENSSNHNFDDNQMNFQDIQQNSEEDDQNNFEENLLKNQAASNQNKKQNLNLHNDADNNNNMNPNYSKQDDELEDLAQHLYIADKVQNQLETIDVLPKIFDVALSPRSAQSSAQNKNKNRLEGSQIEGWVTRNDITPLKQYQAERKNILSPLKSSPQGESREDLFQVKIIHLTNIINVQREQLRKKEEKITFLLNQISELNSHVSQKTSEASSIRVEYAKMQQEMEHLKQQQRIKDEIHSGESKVLEIQIQQEEKLIQQVDQKLQGSTASTLFHNDSQNKQQSVDQNSKKQIDQFLQQPASSFTRPPSASTNALSSKLSFRDSQKPTLNTNYPTFQDSTHGQIIQSSQQQIPQKQQQSQQKQQQQQQQQAQQQQGSFQYNLQQQQLTSQQQPPQISQQYQGQQPKAEHEQQPIINTSSQQPGSSNQILKSQLGHSKNAISHDYVYKKDLVLHHLYPEQQSTIPNSSYLNQTDTLHTPVGGWIKTGFNCLSAGQAQKRSSSNHLPTSLGHFSTNTTNSPINLLQSKDRAKYFPEKSSSQPPTQTSSTGKHSGAKSIDIPKKSESYREQYIKNIEVQNQQLSFEQQRVFEYQELQQRLEFLKQKRVEYEIKPDNLGSSQSTRLASNLSKIYKEKNANQSSHSPVQNQFCMQKLHISQRGQQIGSPSNSSNNSLNNAANSRISENAIFHFAQTKKLENINKDSYFNKQVFSASNFGNNYSPNINFTLGGGVGAEQQEDKFQSVKNSLYESIQGNDLIPKKTFGYMNSISDIALVHGKQYFSVAQKNKIKRNEFSLLDPTHTQERDSISPLKIQSTRNSNNHYKPITESLLLSASLQKEIKNHKMSWDNLAIKESTPLHFAPKSGCNIRGGTSSKKNLQMKNINFSQQNRFVPIQAKSAFGKFQ